MKHVAIVIGQLCSGGAERVAVLWAKGFVAGGNRVTIISDTAKSIDYEIPSGVELCHFDFSEIKKNFLRTAFNFRREIKSLSPDMLITVLYPINILALFATCNLNIPIVNTEHNSFERPNSSRLSFFSKFSKFFFNKFFSRVTILTEADKRVIGKKLKNVSVMPNPLAFAPLETLPIKEKVIVASGRLDAWHYKGFDLLIEAWAKLAREYPDWNLKICGDGSDESLSYLKSLVCKYEVENQITFLGFRKDIQSIYKASSIFVLSSRYEGFGMVLIEAMSQGCACVACDYKGRQHEIIENDSQGVLCEPDNVDSLVVALRKLLADESYRTECQKNAIERSKYYELNNVMKFWDEICKKLL